MRKHRPKAAALALAAVIAISAPPAEASVKTATLQAKIGIAKIVKLACTAPAALAAYLQLRQWVWEAELDHERILAREKAEKAKAEQPAKPQG